MGEVLTIVRAPGQRLLDQGSSGGLTERITFFLTDGQERLAAALGSSPGGAPQTDLLHWSLGQTLLCVAGKG